MLNELKRNFFSSSFSEKGFSLIETLIGSALVLVVFVSLFGVFRLSIRVVGRSRGKAGATALAIERMELIRNLPYSDVGTLAGIPAGTIPQIENVSLNGVDYVRRVFVQYVDDPQDGEGVLDENGITADYKIAKVELSWGVEGEQMSMISTIVPKGIETVTGGGTLIISVFDTNALPVAGANIHIENSSTDPVISLDVSTGDQGKIVFPGSPSSSDYEITITKTDYSSAQTYDVTAQNVNPSPGHLTILEGETALKSFIIDKVSTKIVNTWEPTGAFLWEDLFANSDNVSATSSVDIFSGQALLAENPPETFLSPGTIKSIDITGASNLQSWNEFSWNDNQPIDTNIVYQVFYYDDVQTDYFVIPDSDLSGNEVGFETSPVDLSGLDIGTYDTLRVGATLTTTDASTTPSIFDWQVSWNAGPNRLPNITFNMHGEKIIGTDSVGDPIYKYSEDISSGPGGEIGINNLEFDAYDITVDGTLTGYSISESCPFQPVSLLPDSEGSVDLSLVGYSDHTLLVNVEDSFGNSLSDVDVRLILGGYDKTQTTSSCGQTFFSSLVKVAEPAYYQIQFTKTGYDFATSEIEISGQSRIEFIMSEIQ